MIYYRIFKIKTCEDWKKRGCYDVGEDVYGVKYDVNAAYRMASKYPVVGCRLGCQVEVREVDE